MHSLTSSFSCGNNHTIITSTFHNHLSQICKSSRKYICTSRHIIQMCSGITHGTVFSGKLYAQRFQKLIYLHLFTDCFMKISPQSMEQTQLLILNHLHALYCPLQLNLGPTFLQNNKIIGVFTMLKLCVSKERNM